MLKIQYRVDSLKKGITSEVIDPLEEQSNAQQSSESLHFENRMRRYNPNDTNIAKLFLAIRAHRTGNPQLNKISEIEGLLTQVQNINDIDENDGNTPLHVAVSKDHQDIVDLLLNVPDIDLNIKNKDGKTPLDIAKQSNKQKIIETLEEHLKKSSNQVERLSTQKKEANEKLKKFVGDFASIYEHSLLEYYKRLEGQKGKAGKWAGFVNKILDIGGIGIEGGGEETKAKAFSLMGINAFQLVVSAIGVKHNRGRLKKLMNQVYIFKTNPIKVREELVKSGIEIFQSFESQFMQAKSGGSWQRAMTKLAEDAVSRVIDYYRESNEEEFQANSITKGIILGKSKKYKQISTGLPHINPGHTL